MKTIVFILAVCLILAGGNATAAICPAGTSSFSYANTVLAEYSSDAIKRGCPGGYTPLYELESTLDGDSEVSSVTLRSCVDGGSCWLFLPEGETGSDASGTFVISGGFCPYK